MTKQRSKKTYSGLGMQACTGIPRGGAKGALCPGPQGLEGPSHFNWQLLICDVAISTANS